MSAIILILIIALLSIILFIAINKMIKSIRKDNQDYYFQKVQDLDAQINEKRKELDELLEQNNKENVKNKESVLEKNVLDKQLLDNLSSSEYQSENALQIAKKVDEIFDVNEEKVIKDFLSKASFDPKYELLIKINDRFSPNLIYKLKNLNSEYQIIEIKKLLSDEEYEIFEEYLNNHKFKLNKFILDLNNLIENKKPNIEILVGTKNKNYNYLSPYINTVYSNDIYKGIIIKYQNHLYDYSINERDV